MLFLVVANHRYQNWVPVQIGIQVINQLVATMTEKELQKAGETWRLVHLGTIVSKRNTIESSIASKYDFEGKKGKVYTMSKVMIPPLGTTVVKGMANLTTHSKYFSDLVDPVTGYSEHIATARSYGVLKPGKGKINVCLRNHSARQGDPPKADYSGRDCTFWYDSSSVRPKANMAWEG